VNVALGPSWLEPEQLIDNFGFAGLLLIIFAECGILLGLVLPGDSLLFIAGLLLADDTLSQPLWLACVALWIAAVFARPNSRIFKQEYVEKTAAFFDKHGGRAIVLARFVPIVRTLITFMAGSAKMDARAFTIYSMIGALLWAVGVTVLGHELGGVDFVRDNVEPILLGVVALSLLPIAVHVLRERKAARRTTG
jgi:membrane-associated protein